MKELVWMSVCVGLAFTACAQGAKPAAVGEGAKPAVVEAAKPVAVAEAAKPNPKALNWDGGGDLRVRQEVWENMPRAGGALLPNQNYVRFRPRVWGAVKNEDFKLYMRVTDEMRYYHNPDTSNWRWPDELFLDNLYLDFYNLFNDRVDLRIGRQDFFGPAGPDYGAGRVICDGTPGDGSRTLYMDAVKATIKFDDKNTLDLLGIYNSPDNRLNIGHSYPFEYGERPMNGSARQTEWGGGLYFRSKELPELPYELYYFYKRATKAVSARTVAVGGTPDGRVTHTLGARVMPKISETLSAELEGAMQSGEKDSGPSTSGYMGYAGLTYKPVVDFKAKPFLTGAFYYLSGDDNQGAGHEDEGWDPIWARWPQFSELYAYNSIYGNGYWSNLLYPHVATGVNIAPGHKFSSSLGPMYAAEEDGLGGGDGNLRGWLAVARYDFPLVKNLFGKRGELFGHVTGEVMDPGSYYTSDELAFFLRWEINARF